MRRYQCSLRCRHLVPSSATAIVRIALVVTREEIVITIHPFNMPEAADCAGQFIRIRTRTAILEKDQFWITRNGRVTVIALCHSPC